MNTSLKIALIPLGLFMVFFGIPKLFATLINMHSDIGIAALVLLVCGVFGIIANKYLRKNKGNDNED